MRQTSILTFQRIKESGMLSKRRFQVYEELFHYGPKTIGEVRQKFRSVHPKMSDSSISSRFSELERMNVVTTVGFKDDENTGNRCTLWDVTDNMPVKLDKQPYGHVRAQRKATHEELIAKISELSNIIDLRHKFQILEIYSLAKKL